ncbi:hypothetical protein [Pararhodobacter sp. SW119]|uniref:hypothetical protein n=1 Tax=Pararhodobacter sp. SW119 TaxID=2780075 RepID=UPI001ADF2EE1|nr:hypothetical protein [Pararhodobacter sp. SW119]
MLIPSVNIRANGAPWQKRLAVGDVVCCLFPLPSANLRVTPAPRPCLILEVCKVVGRQYAVLALGCAARSFLPHVAELQVTSPEEIRLAGLAQPTRFLLLQRVTVPLNDSAFLIHPNTATPIMGRLSDAARERLRELQVRLHSPQEGLPKTPSALRRRHSTRREVARPFIVERRKRKRLARKPRASA